MDYKHYRAKQLLRRIETRADLFPIWSLEDHECRGIIFKCLVWEGPGRRVVWTPHALERFLERRGLNIEDDNELVSLQNQLKQVTSQPWLHTFGVGEHAIILRSSAGVYTLVFIIHENQDVVIKTYIDSAKKEASHDFKVVHNRGMKLQKTQHGRELVNQELWSDERKDRWNTLWNRIPKVFDKGAIRRWASEIADVTGDLQIAASALCHIIVGYHHDNLMARIQVGFEEDQAAGASWGVDVARYIENIQHKSKEDMITLADETLNELFKLTPEQRSLYPKTYARFRGKVPMAMPAFDVVCREDYTLPTDRKAFSDRTLQFRELLTKWTTRGVTRLLGVSRSKVNAWYWHADEMPEDLWQLLLTEPLPETHPDELVPAES